MLIKKAEVLRIASVFTTGMIDHAPSLRLEILISQYLLSLQRLRPTKPGRVLD